MQSSDGHQTSDDRDLVFTTTPPPGTMSAVAAHSAPLIFTDTRDVETQRQEMARLAGAVAPHRSIDVPAWQQDIGFIPSGQAEASAERQTIIHALSMVGRHGIILNAKFEVVSGTHGWVAHVRALKTVAMSKGRFGCASLASQQALQEAVTIAIGNADVGTMTVALRDLDGWVQQLLQLRQVGFHNRDLVLLTLPHGHVGIALSIEKFARSYALSRSEMIVLGGMMNGQMDQIVAEELSINLDELKKLTNGLLTKFSVRRKWDIIRLIASTL